jgi:hypothetical protein
MDLEFVDTAELAKEVENKISHIEKKFREAHDFPNTNTGEGLQKDDPPGFDKAIMRICPQYFYLKDVMIERSTMRT